MSKKNAHKKRLDDVELEFDQVLLALREADEAGKMNKKMVIQLKTLQQLVHGVASEVLEREDVPLRW